MQSEGQGTVCYLQQLLLLQGVHHFCGGANALVDCLQQLAFVVDEPDVLMCLPAITMLGRGRGGGSHC